MVDSGSRWPIPEQKKHEDEKNQLKIERIDLGFSMILGSLKRKTLKNPGMPWDKLVVKSFVICLHPSLHGLKSVTR